MKKNVLIGMGVLVLGAGVFIGVQKGDQEKAGTDSGLSAVEEGVSPRSDEGLQDAGGTEQGRQGAGDPIGQVGMSAPQELSDAVKALIGEDEKEHNYSTLLAEINTLSYEIAPDDLAALMAMLDYPNDQFPEGMRPIEINAVKNDVLDKLLRQTVLPEGLGLQIAEMAQNADNDPVWRDYCIQFCPTAWERIDTEHRTPIIEQGMSKGAGGSMASATGEEHVERTSLSAQQQEGRAGSTATQKELTAIREAMFQALEERENTLAGTALIGLENLSRTHAEFEREVIVNKASEIAADEAASSASRMTALRLSAGISNNEQGTGNVEVAQTARSLAQTGETVLMRSAAIVTLGEVGGADDRELLESYLLADDRQIAGAAKMALAKMDAR